ncbi:MAG: helix-turn-helix domain-containing protein [Sneathiella sp.]
MKNSPPYPRRLRTRDAALYCGSTKSTFEKLRLYGDGPPYAKIGRVVVYDVEDLDAWIDSKKHRSTSEYATSF